MSRFKRKILFSIFILAFFIISPIVIFYASGYKLNWKNLLSSYFVQKTGMLIIDSDPSGAEIYLNGKKQKNFFPNLWTLGNGEAVKTPAKIKNLLPGSYDLRVERGNYWPWERRIKILPEQITHVLDIQLFKQELPTLSLLTADQKIKLSPNGKKIILLPSAEIWDIKNERVTKTSSSSSAYALWSDDSGKIILSEMIINLKSPEKNISLTDLLGKNFSLAKWGRSDEEILYLHKDKLSRLNLQTKAAEILLSQEDIQDFLAKKNQIAAIYGSGAQTKLKIFSSDQKDAIKEINLPFSERYSFVSEENKFFNILDEQHSILYLIDPAGGEIKEALNNCQYSDWFDESTLSYGNDFEIWTLNLDSGANRLLTRVSKNKITKIIATETDNYLFYFTDKTANVLTWDKGGESIQPTELARLDEISSPVFNSESGLIYFLGRIGDRRGLYKLSIK